jgi:ABC-type branched-subunit amino acid transport system ATPase component
MLLAPPGQIGESIWNCVVRRRLVAGQERTNFQKALETLGNLGLAGKANAEVSELSGGQRKLLALGQALMREPKLLLLDEPVAGVSPVLVNAIERKLRELGDNGQNILIVEHNIQVIRRICDWVYVMDAGVVIAEGKPDYVLLQDKVMEAYLARNSQGSKR